MCLIESVSWFLANPNKLSLVTRSIQDHWAAQVICKSILWVWIRTLFLERYSFFNLLFWLLVMASIVWQGNNLPINHSDKGCSSYRSRSLEQFIKMLPIRSILILSAENSEIHWVTFFSLISATLELKGLSPHRKGTGWIILSN